MHAILCYGYWRTGIAWFQYRKRYKGACNSLNYSQLHLQKQMFQYRKRYKGACNGVIIVQQKKTQTRFQYRKRYKGACNDSLLIMRWIAQDDVSIP